MVVQWEDPPADGRTRRSSFNDDIKQELRARPGEWAIVKTSTATSTVTRWRKAYDGFEFAARATDGNGLCTIYARYVGDDE